MADPELLQTIAEALDVPSETVTSEASSDSLEAWDSLGHLEVVLAVERRFNVRFRTSEIVQLTSVARLQDALQRRSDL